MDFAAIRSPQFTPTCKNGFWASPNGRKNASPSSSSFSCALPFYCSQRLRLKGNSVIVAAAKKENKNINKKKKEDAHSFVARPDEVTGPFPEAVLLKENKVEEDGRLMPEFADAEERELFESLNLQLESDMKVDQMRHYEMVYLIHENCKEEVEDVNTKIREFLKEKKAKIWRFNDWGMRRLAYEIQKATSAHYILMNFEVEAKWVNEFKNMLNKDERIIRYLVMKRDEAETEDCPPPPEFDTLEYADTDDDDYEWSDEDSDWDDEDDVDGDDEGDEDDDNEDDVDDDNEDDVDDDNEDDDEDDVDDDNEDDDEDEGDVDDDDEDDVDDDDEGVLYMDDDTDDDDDDDDDNNSDDNSDDDDDDDGGEREKSSNSKREKQEAQRPGR